MKGGKAKLRERKAATSSEAEGVAELGGWKLGWVVLALDMGGRGV